MIDMIKIPLKKQASCLDKEVWRMKCGGRGASSGLSKGDSVFKGQNYERGGGKSKVFPNAQANVQIKNKTESSALKYFSEQYKNADIEHGFEIDSNGYVYQNLVGNSHGVNLGASNSKAGITIHNHPMEKGAQDYSHYSATDLRTFADNPKEKTMYVVSRKATYKIKKGTQFNANGFKKAMNSAKAKKNQSYDSAVSEFLKSNARKYHYTYTETKTN